MHIAVMINTQYLLFSIKGKIIHVKWTWQIVYNCVQQGLKENLTTENFY
jgi:hypothetical protein